ncbi:hypothetical protein D3878_19485 [Noviherbaspirillum sedimenti]|uniref:Uncharacterized protein n=2 Tax=Noviherbaspirillum sedimenti TaxID=2320865 RepID=A0A3A3G4V5_9BURK|nr:hypothetical protein D3878_19485 [Noviherbaspirillum sedimenti]
MAGSRVFSVMLGGFAGIVIMDRTVIAVMMAGAFQMLKLMRNVENIFQRRPSALHGKTMQGQKQHQENANETAHG